MLVTTHVLTGGALGAVLKHGGAAFPSSVALHFLADKIPHFWPQEKKYQEIVKYLDGFVAVCFLLTFWFWAPHRAMFWGGLAGFLVDALLVVTPIIKETKLAHWHTKRQPHQHKIIFLMADFFLMVIALTVLGVYW